MGCIRPDVSESARSASRQLFCTSYVVSGETEAYEQFPPPPSSLCSRHVPTCVTALQATCPDQPWLGSQSRNPSAPGSNLSCQCLGPPSTLQPRLPDPSKQIIACFGSQLWQRTVRARKQLVLSGARRTCRGRDPRGPPVRGEPITGVACAPTADQMAQCSTTNVYREHIKLLHRSFIEKACSLNELSPGTDGFLTETDGRHNWN